MNSSDVCPELHILIATGGAPHSSVALESVLLLAPAHARLTMLSVAPTPALRPRAEKIVAAAQARAAAAGFEAETLVSIGRAGTEIVAASHTTGAQLVVVGERPRHSLRSRLMGSVTAYVAEHAPCPVFIGKGAPRTLQRILICDSGGGKPPLIKLFAEARWLHPLTRPAQICVLHVMSQMVAAPGIPARQLSADATELIANQTPEGRLLSEDVASLQADGFAVVPKVRHGLVLDEITTEMREGDYDLIVIGAHRRAGWQSYLLSDLAQAIIAHADRSVLLLRRG